MRLIVDARRLGPHPLLGAGVDQLRWLAPVRPDDVIHLEGEVVEFHTIKDEATGKRTDQMDTVFQSAW